MVKLGEGEVDIFFFRGGGGHMVYMGKRRGNELSPQNLKEGLKKIDCQ